MKKIFLLSVLISLLFVSFIQAQDCPPNEGWISEYATVLVEFDGNPCLCEVYYCYKVVNGVRYNYISQVNILDQNCLDEGIDLSDKFIWDQIVAETIKDQTEAAQWDDKHLQAPPCPEGYTIIVVVKKSCWYWLNLGNLVQMIPCPDSEYDCNTTYNICYDYADPTLPELQIIQVGGMSFLCNVGVGGIWHPNIPQSQCWTTCF